MPAGIPEYLQAILSQIVNHVEPLPASTTHQDKVSAILSTLGGSTKNRRIVDKSSTAIE